MPEDLENLANNISAIHCAFLTYRDDPFHSDPETAVYYEPDGLIIISNGVIQEAGSYSELKNKLFSKYKISDQNITKISKKKLVLPGFIDTHVHYPQIQMLGAHGKHLVDWLNSYVFPVEHQFENKTHAQYIADIFLRECIRAGTTTACVYSTVFPQSVDAFFESCDKINMRMISGKVLMDRNAPDYLLDTAQSGYDDSKKLLNKWHNKNRLHYCITPRFAPTSTPEQLELAGALWKEYPSAYLQTHLSETLNEIEWVKSLYPECKYYLDVYDKYGLVGPRAIFGHGIHLSNHERSVCHHKGAALSHCPTSNLFLGSGLFNIEKSQNAQHPIHTSLGTDLGAGTNFSLLRTLNEAYKVAMLKNISTLDSPHALYLITRGAAKSLYLENKIGSISKGCDADLVVLDMHSTPFIDFRMQYVKNIFEALFLQITCADDRAIAQTFIAGKSIYQRSEECLTGHYFDTAEFLNRPSKKTR